MWLLSRATVSTSWGARVFIAKPRETCAHLHGLSEQSSVTAIPWLQTMRCMHSGQPWYILCTVSCRGSSPFTSHMVTNLSLWWSILNRSSFMNGSHDLGWTSWHWVMKHNKWDSFNIVERFTKRITLRWETRLDRWFVSFESFGLHECLEFFNGILEERSLILEIRTHVTCL